MNVTNDYKRRDHKCLLVPFEHSSITEWSVCRWGSLQFSLCRIKRGAKIISEGILTGKKCFFLSKLLVLLNKQDPCSTSTDGGGGRDWWNPSLDMLQYFEKILPSMESLWSFLQDEICFMCGGAAGGLWRHQTRLLSWLPSWIYH